MSSAEVTGLKVGSAVSRPVSADRPEVARQRDCGAVPAPGATIDLPSFEGWNRSGIYFLYDREVVVYVGQAVDVRRRIADHIGQGLKRFDAVSFIPCRPDTLLAVERTYIERLRPKYNRIGNLDAVISGDFRTAPVPHRIVQPFFKPAEAAAWLGITPEELIALNKAHQIPRARFGRARILAYRILDLIDAWSLLRR